MLNCILVLASAVVATFAVAALALVTNLVAVTAQDLVVLAEADSAPTPCGLASPSLYRLRAGLGAYAASGIASILDNTGSLLDDTRTSLCSSASAVQAVGSVFEGHFVPGSGVWDETEVANAVCSESNVFNYKLRELDGERYVDPLLRVTRAYVAAAPAFARLGSCTSLLNSLDTSCTHGAALKAAIRDSTNYFNSQGWAEQMPTTSEMVQRLLTLSVLAQTDADNHGSCLLNPSSANATQLCEAALLAPAGAPPPPPTVQFCPAGYDTSYVSTASSGWTDVQSAWRATSNAVHGSTAECDAAGGGAGGAFVFDGYSAADGDGECFYLRPRVPADGASNLVNPAGPTVTLCVDNGSPADYVFARDTGFVPTDVGSPLCTESPQQTPPPPPPPLPYASHDISAWRTREVQHCVRTQQYGAYDIDALFGIPNYNAPVSKSVLGADFFAWLGGSTYESLYDSWFLDQRTGNALDSPRLEGLLYLLFRLASTLLWTVPAVCVCCYWIARGTMPVVGILLPFLVSGDSVRARQVVQPAFTGLQFTAITSTVAVFVWACFVDPRLSATYPRPTCSGSSWKSSDGLRNDGLRTVALVGAVVVVVAVYQVLLKKAASSQPPRASIAILQLSLLATACTIVFDALLVAETADEARKQVVSHSDAAALQSVFRRLDRDVSVLFASAALQSFAVGTLTCRWAFLEARAPWKGAWALSVVLAVLIAYLCREYRTERALKDPSAMRTAALWAARGSGIAFAFFTFSLYRDARFKAAPKPPSPASGLGGRAVAWPGLRNSEYASLAELSAGVAMAVSGPLDDSIEADGEPMSKAGAPALLLHS